MIQFTNNEIIKNYPFQWYLDLPKFTLSLTKQECLPSYLPLFHTSWQVFATRHISYFLCRPFLPFISTSYADIQENLKDCALLFTFSGAIHFEIWCQYFDWLDCAAQTNFFLGHGIGFSHQAKRIVSESNSVICVITFESTITFISTECSRYKFYCFSFHGNDKDKQV